MWEPGPRDAGSWYAWVFRVENNAGKRSLFAGRRIGAGAMVDE